MSHNIAGPSSNTRGKKRQLTEIAHEEEQNVKFQKMIAEGIQNAMPTILAAVRETTQMEKEKSKAVNQSRESVPHVSIHTEVDHHSSNGENFHVRNLERRPLKPKGCSYKTFQNCKPSNFNGNEGAVGALRWLEKTEAVLAVSKCAEEDKVLYASNLFQNEALEWWNATIQTKGRERL